MLDHIGEQVDALIGVVCQHGHSCEASIHARAGSDGGSDQLLIVGELLQIAAVGAVAHRLGDECCETALVLRISFTSCARNQRRGENRQRVIFDEVNLQPIVQCEGRRHRQMNNGRRSGLRRRLAPVLRLPRTPACMGW